MSIFRSEPMLLKRIRIPRSTAFEIMNELGKTDDTIEFVDLNKDVIESAKNFSKMIGRCDEMEKKLAKFEKVCQDHDIDIIRYESYKSFMNNLQQDILARHNVRGSSYFDLVENEIQEDEKRIDELIDSYEKLKEGLDYLIEKKTVLAKSTQLFKPSQLMRNATAVDDKAGMLEQGFISDLNYIAGVAKADDEMRMKRMIFRISRGRAIAQFFNYPEEEMRQEQKVSKVPVFKKIFTIFFQSGIENVLLNKMLKICDLFGVSRFTVPRPDELQYELNMLKNDIYEKFRFLQEMESSIIDFMRYRAGEFDEPGRYDLYRKYFKKERQVYTNLNKCVLTEYMVNGEVWIPKEKFDDLKRHLDEFIQTSPNAIAVTFEDIYSVNMANPEEVNRIAPTHFKTNDLINPFQEIVNTYGVPRYQEANPALFTIITFPFLFGVMFGDIGHGLLLLLFATYLCLNIEELTAGKSALKPAVKARYILLFMGFFAFYNGWMYNDFLSIPLNVFGSCYVNEGTVAVKEDKDCVYPFGIDPKWYVSSNELAFFNSLKMKLSVILGVIQMIFGIVLRGMNAIYFHNTLDFFFEFIPQFIFMTAFFGYMILMIFIKWSIDWSVDTSRAPSIITMLMNIFLKKGSVEGKPLWGDAETQETFHFWLLIVCVLCIPVILIPKPIIIYRRQKSEKARRLKEEHLEATSPGFSHINPSHHEESIADLFVHQSIETIEFVLGSISNTASYLRLWALSLAHAQLAKVFFDKALLGFVQQGSLLFVIIGFFIFANVTFAVLMCMDLMECFLHTLRLHWVEFQNKFFKADGVKFNPFSFKYMFEE